MPLFSYEFGCEIGLFYNYESGCEFGSFYAWRNVRRLLVNRYNKSTGAVNTRSNQFWGEFFALWQPVRGEALREPQDRPSNQNGEVAARSWGPGSPFVGAG